MSGYTPGEQPKRIGGWIKLNTNENPYPPSPAVTKALKSFDIEKLRLYPDPDCRKIREFLAELHGVGIENVIAGNGSDDILTMAVRSFVAEGGVAAAPDPSYSLYPVLSKIQGAECLGIPLLDNFSLPANFVEQSSEATLALIPRPNAPTGTAFAKQTLHHICCEFRGVVLIDEAYADFANDDCVEFASEYRNVIVSRTLSKSYSLAGARFGYAIASKEIIEGMMKVKDSYNVNAMTQCVALAALKDQTYFKETVEKIKTTKKMLAIKLEAMGFNVADSSANFLFVRPPDGDGQGLYNSLKKRGVLTRWFDGDNRLSSRIRITIGTDEEIKILLREIKEILTVK
jgi:histidinol-phosphate aminotransferase